MKIDPLAIHGLVDGELLEPERTTVERSISESVEATREYLAVQALKAAIAENAPRVENDELWTRCEKRLEAIDRAHRVEGFVSKYAWGLCGLFFLVIVGGGLMSRNRAGNQVRSGDVARMMSGLGPFSSSSSTPRQADRLLRDTVGEAPVQRQMGNFRPVGQASGECDGRKVACVTLQDQIGRVALVVIADATGVEDAQPMDAGGGDLRLGTYQDMNCVSWSQNGYTLMLMGDRSGFELARIASTIRVR